ncbi:MarR family winged helix-turn-helix transcriptional regulator [Streptomyces cyanogenus]|uniref:Transcriptional regulator HosA n=1 Tax=Streptomyces cyanogenus TaxID=80860 RepID=A0ABX7THH6_STRCY|nr:MarR family winged helix-turn-helix transcriptional regulator [Streptomyces cyanogenus]QTD95904.1 Transcriptional regulator HosA [Streptomyces cyanogenus]
MSDVNGAAAGDASGLTSTVVFRLGTLGTVATDRFTREIEGLGLKPKHVGLMAALSLAAVASQQELAARMGVAPSLMVSLADYLEGLGAVRRVRDPRDRRRQVLTLTKEGQGLLDRCTSMARTLDEEFVAGLTEKQRKALDEALRVMANRAGLP